MQRVGGPRPDHGAADSRVHDTHLWAQRVRTRRRRCLEARGRGRAHHRAGDSGAPDTRGSPSSRQRPQHQPGRPRGVPARTLPSVQRQRSGLQAGDRVFQRAIQLQPDYAAAYAGLSTASGCSGLGGLRTTKGPRGPRRRRRSSSTRTSAKPMRPWPGSSSTIGIGRAPRPRPGVRSS